MLYVLMYLAAIIAANLTVAMWGPNMTIVNAFLFIGLDLTARDRLHDAWHGRMLWPKMATLIAAGSVLSWMINRDAGQIVLASFVAFAAAGIVDAVVYHLLRHRAWWQRVNGSNILSAAVDSGCISDIGVWCAFTLDSLWTIYGEGGRRGVVVLDSCNKSVAPVGGMMQQPTMIEQPKQQMTVGGVVAVWLQNFGGGVGAAVIVGVVAVALHVDWLPALRWGAIVGAVVFGALMLLRSAVDEIVDWTDWQRMMADMEAMEAQIDGLLQRNAALERDLRSEQILSASMAGRRAGEVRHDRNGEPMPSPAPDPVRNDARELVRLHFANGQWPAKDRTCQRLGWETSRWAAARDELQRHGIVTTQNRQTIMLASSEAQALAMLAGDA